jgi:hypothetical protein
MDPELLQVTNAEGRQSIAFATFPGDVRSQREKHEVGALNEAQDHEAQRSSKPMFRD